MRIIILAVFRLSKYKKLKEKRRKKAAEIVFCFSGDLCF